MTLIQQTQQILKRVYKDEVFSSLFRNSPVLAKINSEVWQGEELQFPAFYARSPAISSDATIAKSIADQDSTKAAKWTVPLTQRQLFGSFTISQKEILASKGKAGSFMPSVKFKSFGVIDGLKKELAVMFYGKGNGAFAYLPALKTLVVGSNDIVLKDHELMGIDIGTRFQFGASTGLVPDGVSVNTVTGIDGNTVTFSATHADSIALGAPLIYQGCANATESLAPYGLRNWAPDVPAERTTTFCGVNRGTAPDRLAGQFVDDSLVSLSTGKKTDTIKKMIKIGRRFGGPVSDYIIVVNDNDYEAIISELQAYDHYWQDSKSSAGKVSKVTGTNIAAWAFSTSFNDITIDDPYCPEGTCFMFRPQDVAFVTYSNTAPLGALGLLDNLEGRTDEPMDGPDIGEQPTQVNLQDLFSISGPETGVDGDSVNVKAALYGTFVVYRQANIVVGKFPAA